MVHDSDTSMRRQAMKAVGRIHTMSLADERKRTEERLGYRLPEGTWDLLTRSLGGASTDEYVATWNDMVRAVNATGGLQATSREVVAPRPPASWLRYSERVLAQPELTRRRAAMRELFDIVQPMPVDDVIGRLEAEDQVQRWFGDFERLTIPSRHPDGTLTGKRITAWRGYELGTVSGGSRDGWVACDQFGNPAPADQPLFRLAFDVRHMVRDTGLTELESLLYLLTDELVVLPWIRTSLVFLGNVTAAVELYVGNAAIRPDEVAAAYRQALREADSLATSEASWLSLVELSGGKYRRGQRDSTLELIAFIEARTPVGSRRPNGFWEDAWEAWEGLHPGQYGGADVMKRAYHQAVHVRKRLDEGRALTT